MLTWLLFSGSKIAVNELCRDWVIFLCLAPPCAVQTGLAEEELPTPCHTARCTCSSTCLSCSARCCTCSTSCLRQDLTAQPAWGKPSTGLLAFCQSLEWCLNMWIFFVCKISCWNILWRGLSRLFLFLWCTLLCSLWWLGFQYYCMTSKINEKKPSKMHLQTQAALFLDLANQSLILQSVGEAKWA